VVVLAGEGGGEGVFVSDVAAERWVQTVRLLVREAIWDEDGKLVGHVRVRAKQASKVDVTDGGPFRFGAELGSSAVTQLGDCCSACTWVVFICAPWHRSYSFISRGACMWSTGSQVLSLSG